MKIRIACLAAIIAVVTAAAACKKKPTDTATIKIASVEVSSTLKSKDNAYSKDNLFDGSVKSWCEGKKDEGVGESITISFPAPVVIDKFFVKNGFGDQKYYKSNARVKSLKVTGSGGESITANLKDDHYGVQEVKFGKLIETSKLILAIDSVYKGEKWQDTCLTEISFDKKKISALKTIAQLCTDTGKSYIFGKCINKKPGLVAVLEDLMAKSEFGTLLVDDGGSFYPPNCSIMLGVDVARGEFSCGGDPPPCGDESCGKKPVYSGNCTYSNATGELGIPGRIRCTINECSGTECPPKSDYRGIVLDFVHLDGPPFVVLEQGPYGYSLKPYQ